VDGVSNDDDASLSSRRASSSRRGRVVVLGHRQGGEDPAVVAEPGVEIPLLAEPVGGLVAADTQV
jgi:hypothetical protein